MQVTDEMIVKSAKELDRMSLKERGWTSIEINKAMQPHIPPSDWNLKIARVVLETALATNH